MSIYHGLETLPAEWFPDREAVRAFVRGPRYFALSSLVFGTLDEKLPEPLETESREAGISVGMDLFELARLAALPSEEPFKAPEMDFGCPHGWRDKLSALAAVALAEHYVDEIYEPILEMQAEALQAETEQAAIERDPVKAALAVLSPTADEELHRSG